MKYRSETGIKILISYRELSILKALQSELEWVSYEELGEKLNCSSKTVQNDIKNLRSILPNNWSIESKRGKGLKLHQPTAELVHSIFYSQENREIRRLFQLLIQQPMTLGQLEEQLFSNKNKILALLKYLEQDIQAFNLSLKRSPYIIEGHESCIRFYLFELECSKLKTFDFYEMQKNIEIKYAITHILTECVQLKLTNYGFNMFYSFLEIIVQRIKVGFVIKTTNLNFMYSETVENYCYQLKKLFTYLEQTFNILLNSSDRLFLTSFLLHVDYQFDEIYQLPFSELKKRPDFDIFTQWFERLKEFFQFKGDYELLFRHIYNLVKVAELKSKNNDVTYMPAIFNLPINKKEIDSLVPLVELFLAKHRHLNDVAELNYYSKVELALLLKSHLKKRQEFKIEIVLISSLSNFKRELLKEKLESQLPKVCEVDVVDLLTYLEKQEIYLAKDIIITDTYLGYSQNTNVVLLDQENIDKGVNTVKTLISDVRETKIDSFIKSVFKKHRMYMKVLHLTMDA